MTGNLIGMLKAAAPEGGEFDIKEMILHHLADSKELELPFIGAVHLPQFEPLHLGALTLDFSITKHVVWMMVAAVLVLLLMLYASAKAKRERAAGAERGRCARKSR